MRNDRPKKWKRERVYTEFDGATVGGRTKSVQRWSPETRNRKWDLHITGSLDLYDGLAEASHRVVQHFSEQSLRSDRAESESGLRERKARRLDLSRAYSLRLRLPRHPWLCRLTISIIWLIDPLHTNSQTYCEIYFNYIWLLWSVDTGLLWVWLTRPISRGGPRGPPVKERLMTHQSHQMSEMPERNVPRMEKMERPHVVTLFKKEKRKEKKEASRG